MSVLWVLAVAFAPAVARQAAFAPVEPARWLRASRSGVTRTLTMSSPPARTGGGGNGDDGDDYRRQIQDQKKPPTRAGIQRLLGNEPLDMSPEAVAERKRARRDPNSNFNKIRRARKNAQLELEAEARDLGMTAEELMVMRAQEELGENFERWGMMPTLADGEDPFSEELDDDEDIFIREEDIPEGMSEDDPSIARKVILRRMIDDRLLDPDYKRLVKTEPSVGETRDSLMAGTQDALPNWMVYTDEDGTRHDIRPGATKEDLPYIFKFMMGEWRAFRERNVLEVPEIPRLSKAEMQAAWEQFQYDNRHLPDSPDDLPPGDRGVPALYSKLTARLDQEVTAAHASVAPVASELRGSVPEFAELAAAEAAKMEELKAAGSLPADLEESYALRHLRKKPLASLTAEEKQQIRDASPYNNRMMDAWEKYSAWVEESGADANAELPFEWPSVKTDEERKFDEQKMNN